MPTPVTESDTWETNVVAPVGSDVMNAQGVRDAIQDAANRTRWLKNIFVEVQEDSLSIDGNSYTAATNDISAADLTFLNIKSGDLIVFVFSVAIKKVAGTNTTAQIMVRNASDSLTVGDSLSFAFNDTVTKIPGTCVVFWVAPADAASKVFRPRILVGGTTPEIQTDDGTFAAIRFRRGTT
jgi:hypothetical protein